MIDSAAIPRAGLDIHSFIVKALRPVPQTLGARRREDGEDQDEEDEDEEEEEEDEGARGEREGFWPFGLGRALGALLGLLGGVLSASWGLLGASWGGRRELSVRLPTLGPFCGPSLAVLGAPWAVLERRELEKARTANQ